MAEFEKKTILNLQNVSVSYGGFDAVKDMSFVLNQGESLALLGRNGAGKTSTLRVILGMVKPAQGQCEIFGHVPGALAAFKELGFAPEEALPPAFLSGQEYLKLVCDLKKVSNTEVRSLLDWFELPPKKRVSDYSKGMNRRLILAQALVGNPKLLILDEPLNGLDPIFIKKLRDRLESFCRGGGSLIFSSHILAEVERVCTQVIIIDEGRLKMFESAMETNQKYGSIEQAFVSLVGETREKHPTA